MSSRPGSVWWGPYQLERVTPEIFTNVVKEDRRGVMPLGKRLPVVGESSPAIEDGIAEAQVGPDHFAGELRMFQEQRPAARAIGLRAVVDQERDAELALEAIHVARERRARRIRREVNVRRLHGL